MKEFAYYEKQLNSLTSAGEVALIEKVLKK